MKNIMHGTKEGKLYIVPSELFKLKSTQSQIEQLAKLPFLQPPQVKFMKTKTESYGKDEVIKALEFMAMLAYRKGSEDSSRGTTGDETFEKFLNSRIKEIIKLIS